jgi:hypothetical protein
LRNAFHGGIEIGVGIDDDRIFPAHFEDGALDPKLTGLLGCRGLINVQSNFARTGEGDVARLGMRNDCIAERGTAAGTEIHHLRASQLLPAAR